MRRSDLGDWFYYAISWTLLTLAFSYTSLLTVRYFIDFFELESLLVENRLAAYMVSDYQFLEALLFGFSFGTFIFFINNLVDRSSIHKLSFGTIIFLKTLLYTVAVIIVFIIVYSVVTQYHFYDSLGIDQYQVFRFITPSMVFFFLSFFISATLLINFLAQINKKFGPGNLINMFLGRYHHPRVENRIFLFIDLKNSTTIAEKLGHLKYSKFLKACFIDLNYLIPRYHAEVYQYVGDEAVITWRTRRGLKNLACIQFFFSFKKRIISRSDYYQKKFDVVPEFKAGIHLGEITTVEVGVLKREIAYHGDVINTASRIQDLCNHYRKELLATQAVVRFIPKNDYKITYLDRKQLRGKKRHEEVFSID